jgi:hypothetical protein
VDEEKAIACIHRAFELGVNLIDTALMYGAGQSEVIVGKALKGWRDKVTLSTKNPGNDADGETWRRTLEQQLKKLDVDRIDLYQMHDLRWEVFQKSGVKPGGALEAAHRAQAEGLFTYLGYSCHDTPENMMKLADTGEFTTLICQYNLLDRANEPAIAHAKEKGMGVLIMGPVGGGRLGAPSPEIRKLLPRPAKSTAEIALRFVLSNPNVSAALSGMNSVEMVEENCATASRKAPLSAKERAAVLAQLEEKKKLAELYCTGCDYCLPCPQGVAIPAIFTLMNYLRLYGLEAHAKAGYAGLARQQKSAEYCDECRECEEKCPQKIPIVDQLKETHDALG